MIWKAAAISDWKICRSDSRAPTISKQAHFKRIEVCLQLLLSQLRFSVLDYLALMPEIAITCPSVLSNSLPS